MAARGLEDGVVSSRPDRAGQAPEHQGLEEPLEPRTADGPREARVPAIGADRDLPHHKEVAEDRPRARRAGELGLRLTLALALVVDLVPVVLVTVVLGVAKIVEPLVSGKLHRLGPRSGTQTPIQHTRATDPATVSAAAVQAQARDEFPSGGLVP